MNTKILLRTINDLEKLKVDLENKGFKIQISQEKMGVQVQYSDVKIFGKIIKKHLNAPYNYANVKFPYEKLNVLIFPKKDFTVTNERTDQTAKDWALSTGLSKPETDWTTFY